MTGAGWLTGLAGVLALAWLLDLLYVGRGVGRVGALLSVPPAPDETCPPATVCMAARDEAADVESAVRSFLALDYPELEVVAVDDRSTDGTGAILDRMAAEEDRLTARHVEELPEGWLGKTHALHLAAREAGGELLLFTDADVTVAPDALRRAVGRMERRGLDHLTAPPTQAWPTALLRTTGALLELVILHRLRPWRIGRDGSDAYAGVGAFNLVRAEAYRGAGGHEAIARRPVDDMALAQRLHEAGARSELVWGHGLVRVRWYERVGAFVRGIGRSTIANFGYSTLACGLASALVLLLHVAPWVGALLLRGPARWLCLVPVAGALLLYRLLPDAEGARARDALWWPVAGLIMAWTPLRAALLYRWRGGIEWRGTFYPREELAG